MIGNSCIRSALLAVAVLFYSVPGLGAENFSCGSFFCSCDINVPTDCDKMKKNCKSGTITACAGTACYCAPAVAGLRIGTPKRPPPKEIQRLLAPEMRLAPK
jgi:hypothetical protein